MYNKKNNRKEDLDMEHLKAQFENVFNEKATAQYFAPGRINLIGEHTDYNGGHVFPAAITLGTYGLVSSRKDREVHVYSENFPDKGVIVFTLDDLVYKKEDDWANYPKGVLAYLIESGYQLDKGLNILFYGNIPNGAGLSSSASIELLTGIIAKESYHLAIERLDLVKLGQKVENHFIGVNSGIMDQFAIGMGKKEHAMLLDTNTLKFEYVPAVFGEYVIAIMNTNKRRELADSKYNERRQECEDALEKIQTKKDVHSLGELTEDDLIEVEEIVADETLFRRARHAITENERTLKAKSALETNDLDTFGQLLNASHHSLKEDYAVTGIELDTLVAAAQAHEACLGARMTGAGFGGCAIALVKQTEFDDFVEAVSSAYVKKIGYNTDIYQASIDDGARKL